MKDALRISVTQRCNMSCEYCHNEGQMHSETEMSVSKIREIAEAAKKAGIKKIKITGGEPLLRSDIVEIVKAFRDFDDVSIVTNGFRLEEYADKLKAAGLKRINIGCDFITTNINANGTNSANNVLKSKEYMIKGLIACKKAGIHPIKLNMVVLKDINHHQIKEMIAFAREMGVILQLIELIDVNTAFYKKHYYNLDNIEKYFESKALLVTKKDMQNRMIYNFGDSIIEIVKPFKNHFCEECKRLRITSDGKIKRCLLNNSNLVEFNGTESLLESINRADMINKISKETKP